MTLVFSSLNKLYLKDLENVFRSTQFPTPPIVMDKCSDYLMARLPGPVVRISPAQGETVGTSRLTNLGNGYYHIHAGVDVDMTRSENAYWGVRTALLLYLDILTNHVNEWLPKYIIIEPFGSIERLNSTMTVYNMHNAILDTLL